MAESRPRLVKLRVTKPLSERVVGCVVIDKPGAMTSHDVVAKVRKRLQRTTSRTWRDS